ncbi:MAG: recombinase family protein, partial [Sulfuritalea sp.]|nr:recombinase family protein [Sulfuritalea sp.]
MRAAIYARYSTDMQDYSSIEDQYRVCEERAEREGWTVVLKFEDAGISGAAIGNRPGFNQMLAAAKAKKFDALLVMELSRLSRSTGDLNKAIDRFVYQGIRVIGVSNGYDSARKGHKLQAGLEGIMGEAFRDMIADKTYTALHGRAQRGAATGGKSYGYTHTISGTADAPIYQRTINEDEAAIVREIFERYVAGESPRTIACTLNSRGVPPPGA